MAEWLGGFSVPGSSGRSWQDRTIDRYINSVGVSGSYAAFSFAQPSSLFSSNNLTAQQVAQQNKVAGQPACNPINGRKVSCGGQSSVHLPSINNANVSPYAAYPQPPSSSPSPTTVNTYTLNPAAARFVMGGAASQQRDPNPAQPFSRPSASHAPAPAVRDGGAASGQPAHFHRSRSSFLPNKWARGPGDGTFGSIYLTYGADGGDLGRSYGGMGPNLNFGGKRADELAEEEQQRRRGTFNETTTNKKKKKRSTMKKKSKSAATSTRRSRQDLAARKLLIRSRHQLLAHLSSPNCRLFSEAKDIVAVSDDDLDELLRAGGGDVNKVIGYLTAFDVEQRKFENFDELMRAIIDARVNDGDHGLGTELNQHQPVPEQEEKSADVHPDVQPAVTSSTSTTGAEVKSSSKPASSSVSAAASASPSPRTNGKKQSKSAEKKSKSPTTNTSNGTADAEKASGRAKKKGSSKPSSTATSTTSSAKTSSRKAAAASAVASSPNSQRKVEDGKKDEVATTSDADTAAANATTTATTEPEPTKPVTPPQEPAPTTTKPAAAPPASPGEDYGDDFD